MLDRRKAEALGQEGGGLGEWQLPSSRSRTDVAGPEYNHAEHWLLSNVSSRALNPMDALTDSQLPRQRHSWRRAESATCIENFRRASRNFTSSFLHPFNFFPTSLVSPFLFFSSRIVESGRCPIVIMAAGKASGKAAASFDEIIRAGTATPLPRVTTPSICQRTCHRSNSFSTIPQVARSARMKSSLVRS